MIDAWTLRARQVAGGPALGLLREEELELLVCGQRHLDFGALQAAARYEGGYSASHPVVQAFWEVVRALPLAQQRAFLAFATGSDRCRGRRCHHSTASCCYFNFLQKCAFLAFATGSDRWRTLGCNASMPAQSMFWFALQDGNFTRHCRLSVPLKRADWATVLAGSFPWGSSRVGRRMQG